jgi:hypothetical protein
MIAYNSVLTPTQVSNLFNYYSSIALPVLWGSFTGQVEAGQSYLQWTTANSSIDARFEIERSAAGVAFSKIGDIPAGSGAASAGDTPTTAGSLTYNFIDTHPAVGDNYYRIEGIDADGSSSWTSILELTVANASAAIRLQSNPVADVLTLVNNGGITINRLQVLDVTGRVLLDQAPYSSNYLVGLNTSGLKAGYYFLRIGESGNTVTLAFLKL